MLKLILNKILCGLSSLFLTFWIMYIAVGYKVDPPQQFEAILMYPNGCARCEFLVGHFGYIPNELTLGVFLSTLTVLLIQLILIRFVYNYFNSSTFHIKHEEKSTQYWQI